MDARDKICRKCGRRKPLTEFYKAFGTRDGRRGECKVCNLAAQQTKRDLDPRPNRRRVRAWQMANPERYREGVRRYKANNPAETRYHDRNSHLLRKYGLSVDDFDQLVAAQAGKCAICGRHFGPELHVDHEHVSGRIRGLLCGKCNKAIGLFDDDPGLVRDAAIYLETARRSDPHLIALQQRLPGLCCKTRRKSGICRHAP